MKNLNPGEPCSHPGCCAHMTHPCEVCGRVACGSRIQKGGIMNEGKDLKSLGSGITYKYENPTKEILEGFENKNPDNIYDVVFETKEFTSCCPKTGQPDFAEIKIFYQPNLTCIETKSLKLYLFAFRNHNSFMETITNKILNDLVAVCKPRFMRVSGEFYPRGGISLTVHANYTAEDVDEDGWAIDEDNADE